MLSDVNRFECLCTKCDELLKPILQLDEINALISPRVIKKLELTDIGLRVSEFDPSGFEAGGELFQLS